MSTFVAVNTYTHSVTYVTENILRSLQDIVRMSGLDPNKISDDWETIERGIRTWLDSKHLERIVKPHHAEPNSMDWIWCINCLCVGSDIYGTKPPNAM